MKTQGCEWKLSAGGASLAIRGAEPGQKNVWLPLAGAVAVVCGPVAVFCSLAAEGEGIPFGFVVSCAVAALVSGYLLKLYLWNKYGEEHFFMGGGVFLHYYDYRFFRECRHRCRYEAVAVRALYGGRLRKPGPRLARELGGDACLPVAFVLDKETVVSHCAVPLEIICKMAGELPGQGTAGQDAKTMGNDDC